VRSASVTGAPSARASGDLIGVLFFGVLFTQWVRSSMKEAAREDRRLDLAERRSR
jgi:putative copper resistance protein D